MARRVKFKAGHQKNDMQETVALTLNQKRHDAAGNKVPGYTFDQIAAMGPVERERVRQAGWLGEKSKRR